MPWERRPRIWEGGISFSDVCQERPDRGRKCDWERGRHEAFGNWPLPAREGHGRLPLPGPGVQIACVRHLRPGTARELSRPAFLTLVGVHHPLPYGGEKPPSWAPAQGYNQKAWMS